MSNNTTLMNFRVPIDLKSEFESTCRSLHLPMTAQLIFMMRAFIAEEQARHRHRDAANDPIPFITS